MRGRPALQLAGMPFGRLTPLRRAGRKNAVLIWLCQCACGATTKVTSSDLSGERTRSCGCLRRELTAERFRAYYGNRGELYLRLRERGWTLRRIAKRYGVSFQTVSVASRRAPERRGRSLAVRRPWPA
jgi:hypothetical protein